MSEARIWLLKTVEFQSLTYIIYKAVVDVNVVIIKIKLKRQWFTYFEGLRSKHDSKMHYCPRDASLPNYNFKTHIKEDTWVTLFRYRRDESGGLHFVWLCWPHKVINTRFISFNKILWGIRKCLEKEIHQIGVKSRWAHILRIFLSATSMVNNLNEISCP